MNSFTTPPVLATIIPSRAIGEFTAYLTIEETTTDELTVSQHPIETGASIADHAYMKPAMVTASIAFADTESEPIAQTYQRLRDLQASRVPFDLVTGRRIYTNMLITSLANTVDASTANILIISIGMQQIAIVETQTLTVPPRPKHANPSKTAQRAKAGIKQAKPTTGQSTGKIATIRQTGAKP